MKAYILTATCPFYGDVDTIGVYVDKQKLKDAKEITIRCSRIDNYGDRLTVDEYETNELPYDSDA